MREFPTRFHRLLAPVFAVGLLLLLFSSLVGDRLTSIGMVVFGGSALGLTIADMRYMLSTRRGLGVLSSHVTEKANPLSFRLHVVLLCILALVWVTMLLMGVGELK